MSTERQVKSAISLQQACATPERALTSGPLAVRHFYISSSLRTNWKRDLFIPANESCFNPGHCQCFTHRWLVINQKVDWLFDIKVSEGISSRMSLKTGF